MLRSNTTVLAIGDALEVAINSAKRGAQLLHDFEYCRTTCSFAVNLTSGALVSSGVDTVDDVTVRDVKRIEAAALSGEQPLYTLDQVSYRRYVRRRTGLTTDEIDPPPSPPYVAMLVTQNNRIYLKGSSLSGSSVNIVADVVYFLDDYAVDGDTDFFLTRGTDWMLMAVAQRLNFFLKDDERIPVNTALMRERWNDLLAWDGALSVTSDQYGAD